MLYRCEYCRRTTAPAGLRMRSYQRAAMHLRQSRIYKTYFCRLQTRADCTQQLDRNWQSPVICLLVLEPVNHALHLVCLVQSVLRRHACYVHICVGHLHAIIACGQIRMLHCHI